MTDSQAKGVGADLRGDGKTPELSFRRPAFVLLALVMVIIAGGYFFYNAQRQQLLRRAQDELSAIAQLKVNQLAVWRQDRLGDAKFIMDRPFYRDVVAEWMTSQNPETAKKIRVELELLQRHYPYQDILLVDTNGKVLMAINSTQTLSDATLSELAFALRENTAVIVDFYNVPGAENPLIDIVAPLSGHQKGMAEATGAMVLIVNPGRDLYPLVQFWPTPSRTSETLLVRRDGDSALFLNELRHQAGTALELRIPIGQQEVPAAIAAAGKEGFFIGEDYRGVAVVADIRRIPDSPWFMIAKTDSAEAFSAMRTNSVLILGLIAGSIILTSVIVVLLWQRRQRIVYQALYRAESARKKAEDLQRQLLKQVENERARLTAVIQQMPAGVVVAETSGEVILVNSRAEALWQQQFSGPYSLKRFDDAFPMFHPDGRRYHITERPLARALRGETVAGEEIEVIHGDGSRGIVLVSGAPIHDAEGNLVAGVITHLDITERRKAEEALLAERAHLAAILESVPVLTLVVDADRRILELNDAAVGFSGKPIAEVVGLRGGEALGCLHSLDDPRGCGFGPSCQTCQVRLDVLDTLETGNNHYKVEWRLPFMRDGKVEEMTFLFSTTRLPGSEKQALICIDDITDMKKAETKVKELNETLRQRAAELEAVNHELEAFAYSVSHDLRAPLRSMAGFSDALLEDYGDRLDEQGRQYLNWIKESGGVMGELIDDLLQLSRVTRAEMRHEPVDLSTLARDILAELKRAEPERHVQCSVGRGLTCYGDSRLLRLALENLLGNAWKFTSRSASPRIEVSVTEIDGTCVYFVRDNGAGFDMTYADKLFRPFQRLHRADDFPGTGIGLATVQRIIHRHGGRIWAEGKENEGATFYFALE